MNSRKSRGNLTEPANPCTYIGGPILHDDFHRIAERRGKNKARVAVARKLLTLVCYGLRDGEIRCLQRAAA